jgi:Protein of unknown function (DUF1580)
MVDINREQLLTFTEAAKLLPGRPNVATLWRWRTAGCRGVKLETVLVGGKRYTSREALQRFVDATTAAADGAEHSPQSNRQRSKSIDAAKSELEEAGI